jgi:hypothetical protein
MAAYLQRRYLNPNEKAEAVRICMFSTKSFKNISIVFLSIINRRPLRKTVLENLICSIKIALSSFSQGDFVRNAGGSL